MTDPANPPVNHELVRELHINGVHTKCPADCLARWDAHGNDIVPGYAPLGVQPAEPVTHRSRGALLIAGGVLAVGAIATVLSLTLGGSPGQPLTLKFTLFDVDDGGSCATGGFGGYGDIGPGQPVTVKDETGKVLASTTLPDSGEDAGAGMGCTWTMHVVVPDDAEQYGVEVGRRGTVTYSRDEIARNDWVVETGIS